MKSYKFLIGIWISAAFFSCNEASDSGTLLADEPVVIELSGAGMEMSTSALRAASDFPNNQIIGVIAADYVSNSIDWTSYSDIQNETARAATESGGTFRFTWNTTKYWPFDGAPLVFMAYSPVADGAAVTLANGNMALDLTLVQNMPDVMYASNNETAETTPYTKAMGDNPVDLGEFRHATSKITVKVLAGDNMNPDVRIESLIVATPFRTATLDLLAGDNGLTVAPEVPDSFKYVIVDTSTRFDQTDFTRDIYLFPGTEDGTMVYLKLSDGYFSVEGWYAVAAFENENTGLGDLEFLQGENTILTFTVVGTLVQNPNDAIVLQGLLTDWKEKGEYEVNIQ